MAKLYPVIMCGGAGSRLWPLSRKATPKQYLALVEERTMLQATAARNGETCAGEPVAAPTLVCGAGQEAVAARQLEEAGRPADAILVEPCPRNTAAVAAAAAAHVAARDPDGVVLLLPADHHMGDEAAFWRAVEAGLPAARAGKLVTLGIAPAWPETGYGYIRAGEAIGEGVFEVAEFVEKPDAETAEAYLKGGEHFWNAGIFLFEARAMLEEFERLAPSILGAARAALAAGAREGAVLRLDPGAFEACPSAPVDKAIMEKTGRAAVVAPVEAGWNDIGSWAALSALVEDETRGDVAAVDCENTLVRSDGPFVAAVGLKDMVVVASGDAVLVLPKDRAQDVKSIVELLKARRRDDLL